MSGLKHEKMQKGTVLWLALRDLRHDVLINLNLVLGTAAIIAPLLILFGVKFGTIETMRNRLLEDPRNLEIRQLSSQSYSKAWFKQIKQDKRVVAVIPMTRKLASTVILTTQDKSIKTRADLIPTKANDPLVLQNGGIIPTALSASLSSRLAKELNVKTGDVISMSVTRYMNRKIDKASIKLTINSILNPRASFLKTIYLPLELAEKVEQFKDGLAVIDLGWKGGMASAYPVYDGVFVLLKKPLGRVEKFRLVSGTGFSKIEQLSSSKASTLAGYDIAADETVYFIQPYKNQIKDVNIKALEIKLRGKKYRINPWIKPLSVTLNVGGEKVNKQLLIAPDSWKLEAGVIATKNPSSTTGKLETIQKNHRLSMPVKLSGFKHNNKNDYLFANSSLAGKLALFKERDLIFDSKIHSLILARRNYAGFRLYAKSLDDVEPLKKYFEDQGISVSTQAERIHDVKMLDRYMGIIFWLIAIVGVIGGTATLSASLYSSVERKRRELSILRLLGLSKTALFRFPVYQGSAIAIGGVFTALLFFLLMAWVINYLFKAYLGKAESFCRLTTSHIILVFGFIISVAIISSTIAAFKATQADPAEAMRDE